MCRKEMEGMNLLHKMAALNCKCYAIRHKSHKWETLKAFSAHKRLVKAGMGRISNRTKRLNFIFIHRRFLIELFCVCVQLVGKSEFIFVHLQSLITFYLNTELHRKDVAKWRTRRTGEGGRKLPKEASVSHFLDYVLFSTVCVPVSCWL